MATLRSLPSVSRSPGVYNLPSIQIGTACDAIKVSFSRAGLPLGPVAVISLELSKDGGVTWAGLGGISLGGGTVINKSGGVETESYYTIEYQANGVTVPFSPTDRIRGSVTVIQTAKASVTLNSLP